MHPEVLSRLNPDGGFEHLIDQRCISEVINSRKWFRNGNELDDVYRFVGEAMMTNEQCRRVIECGKATPSGDGSCRSAEERCIDSLIGTVILVGRIPENLALAQMFECATNILAIEHAVAVAQPAAQHEGIEQRVVVGAVGDGKRKMLGQQVGGKIQGRVMSAEHEHTLAFGQCCLHMMGSTDHQEFAEV